MEQAFVNICAVHGRPMHYLSFKHCVYTFNQKQQARTEIHNFSIAQTFIHSTRGWVARLSEICLFCHPSLHLQVPVYTSVFIWIHSMLISLCSLSFSQLIFADSFQKYVFLDQQFVSVITILLTIYTTVYFIYIIYLC